MGQTNLIVHIPSVKLIDKILIFCLFFVCISCYSQTNLFQTTTNKYINMELGVNYSGSKFGGSCRLSYELNPNVEIGVETDYISGTLYQSSGNGKLGKNLSLGNYGSVFLYAMSGAGVSLENKVGNTTGLIGIIGIGSGYATSPFFKLFGKYPTRLTFCAEIDQYSNINPLVFKQYGGIRIEF